MALESELRIKTKKGGNIDCKFRASSFMNVPWRTVVAQGPAQLKVR